MNKNAIKKFAIDARNKLIASVTDKAGMLGITANGISDAITKGRDFEVYKTSAGTEVTLNRTQSEQRRRLVAQIEARGFEAVIEEVAYTWFNRICAIRFMEVNDYLPVRVLSSIKDGKTEPDIVTNAPDVEIDFTDAEKGFILEAKVGNKLDELFRMLFIKQCHELNDILPELFEKTEDYTEMLLNISYTNEDDVIRMLLDTVDEKDFNVTTLGDDGKPTGQVEIIGWLYQYYNTELKDDTFAKLKKNVKITKERIPAATQLFTPDWIVRYMVENSVGRIWIEHLRAVDPSVDEKVTAENFGWKYYLPEAEQEESVNVKLAEIRTSYANLKPEDITCIDPCMGSGHILIAMFDVLMDIYKSIGYSEKEAAFSIVENNIHGLDIDKRAYQLAYFAVMMKGRGYNRRFFRGHDDMKPQPKVYAIQESNRINRAHIKYFGAGLGAIEKNNALNQIDGLLHAMTDAREYGSILNVDNYDWDLLRRFAAESGEDNQLSFETVGIDVTQHSIQLLIDIGEIIANKYSVVVTNPPYMGNKSMNDALLKKVQEEFPDSKADLFAVFIEVSNSMLKANGFQALITQHAWMFLSSFEKLREKVYIKDIINMSHLGPRAFEEISGEVVQTTSFVIRNSFVDGYVGTYVRLVDALSQDEKEKLFLSGKNRFCSVQQSYENIGGKPVAYWASQSVLNNFKNNRSLIEFSRPRVGQNTGDNERFLRLWFEVEIGKIGFGTTHDELETSPYKWIPYNKGGSFRRWYGNFDRVVNWENDGKEIKDYAVVRNKGKHWSRYIQNIENMCREGISWSDIASTRFGCRYLPEGFICDVKGSSTYPTEEYRNYILAYLNSKVAIYYLQMLNPTTTFQVGNIGSLPFVYSQEDKIKELAQLNIDISKADWDSVETSWDFKVHPLCKDREKKTLRLENLWNQWSHDCEKRFNSLKANEEELNKLFIQIHGLENELSGTVNEEDVTVQKADMLRDIKSLISYAVGCMFGRYSIDEEGLIYAGGKWNIDRFLSFIPDENNIIPITDEEYFDDDIVGKFCIWISSVFGEESLEDNLDFIAKVLGGKGNTAREVIRYYFSNDFFKDHCAMYSVSGSGKRPIYWMFDTGKEGGFRCLIYMHRYSMDTVGRIRTEYLHKTQKAIEQAMYTAERIRDNSTNGTEKSNATKRIAKYTRQLAEIQQYDEAMAHVANQRIELNLDDGFKVNYAKFQGIEVSQEGKKAIRIDLLPPVK